MIRINLLESITDKPTSAAVIVEKKMSNPGSRFGLIAAVIGGLLFLGVGLDYYSATSGKANAEAELKEQERVAKEMETVIKEQAELKQKIDNIENRIKAIKDLRASQAGPSAVLQALSERIVNVPGLYLESVEQKGDQLTIKGNSPDENAVTSFGRSLEFSSGLFTNLNIETQRKELQATQVSAPDGTAPTLSTGNPDAKVPETVNFTIRISYSPSKASNPSTLPGGQQTANNATPGAPNTVPPPAAPQVVKN